MLFFRRNRLERAMHRAARDPELQEEFYVQLLGARLIVPVAPSRSDERGRRILAVFSSAAAFREVAPDEPFEEKPAPEALKQLASENAPVILNPGTDLWYEFSADEVQALAAGKLPGEARLKPRVMPAGHRIALGLPEENPIRLKQALRTAFDGLPSVRAAWLLEMADEEAPRLFLGIELDEPDDDEMARVMALLDPVLQEELGDGQLLDAALLNGTDLMTACRDLAPPFFRR